MFGKIKKTKDESENFKVNFEKEQTHETAFNTSTRLGRAATTIGTALKYHKKKDRTNPIPLIMEELNKNNYYGQTFEDNKPFVIPQDEITHSIFVGSTGTGKGVILGNRVLQSIQEGRGVIIVDPKNDSFLPQIITETLATLNRPKEDFNMCYFPNKWGYKAITENDTYLEISNKLIDMFNFTPTENSGVDYYRGLGRTLLRRLMKMFFVSFDLDVSIKKDFEDIQKHIIFLKQDLERMKLHEKEIGKNRPNAELLEEYAKRFYNPEILKTLYFANSDIETLDNLATKFTEVSEGVTFQANIDIQEALYNSKIVYIRVDMNDIASLNWTKYIITDIIQKSKNKKANTDIYLDELSFYASKTLSGALATVRSMGLNFSLFLQAISQLDDEVKDDILENCNFKMFYKSSNLTTLQYIDYIGGQEAITKISTKDNDNSFSQDFENFLNPTKIRALPRTMVGVIIAEYLPFPQIVQTNFIAVSKPFDWSIYQNETAALYKDIKADSNKREIQKEQKAKIDKYKVFLKENKNLLENSDLFGITLGSEAI